MFPLGWWSGSAAVSLTGLSRPPHHSPPQQGRASTHHLAIASASIPLSLHSRHTEERVRRPGEMLQGLLGWTCDGCEVVRFHRAGKTVVSDVCRPAEARAPGAPRSRSFSGCASDVTSRFCRRSVTGAGRAIATSPANHLRSTRVDDLRGNSGHAHSVPSRVGSAHPRERFLLLRVRDLTDRRT